MKRSGGLAAANPNVAEHATILTLFIVMALQPFAFQLGGALPTPLRLFTMVMFVPALMRVVSGKAGKLLLPDVLMIAYVGWTFVCLAVNQGIGDSLVYWLSQTAEVVGSYLIGRAYVRTREDFIFLIKALLLVVVCMLPLAMFESVTGRTLIPDLYRKIPGLSVNQLVDYERRLGLRRSQVVFAHPILFGIFCMLMMPFAWCGMRAMGADVGKRLRWTIAVALATFFSVSSGALAGLVSQIVPIVWAGVLRTVQARWKIFLWSFIALYVFLEFYASHSPIVALVSKLTFSGATAWNRIQIWEFGSAELARHPIFGMGHFNDWVRAPWMPLSIDNHWLLLAMRYGYPGILMFLGAYFAVLFKLGRIKTPDDPGLTALRQATVFSLSGVFIGLCTVAAWEGAYSTVMLILGAGGSLALFTPQDGEAGAEAAAPQGRRQPRYGRGKPKTPDHDSREAAVRYTRFPGKNRPT